MKKFLSLILAIILMTFALVSCDNNKTAVGFNEIDFRTVTDISKVTTTDKETDYVLLDVKDYGKILIRLYPEVAPKTVKNFKKLVSEGFYDGIIFHRIIEGFVIQGGDPDGNGQGGSDKTIKGEFNKNGFRNNLSHVRGVVSMARLSTDMNSATSQFFICQTDDYITSLDGQYASFGFVANGMAVVDAIAAVSTSSSTDKPYEDVVITSAKFAVVSDDLLSDTPEPDMVKKNSIELNDQNFNYTQILNTNLVTESDVPTNYVCMDIADYGKVYLRLFPDTAPETVSNFKNLVSEGFYDGLTFHRTIKNFMIQGGDPEGTGFGGSDKTIKGEFLSNGFKNNLKHTRGVISMARTPTDNDSASSQFFICQKDFEEGDGNYAAFGYVISGIDIVDEIAKLPTDEKDTPLKKVVINSVRFVNVPNSSLLCGIDSIEGIHTTDKETNYVLIDVNNFGKMVVRLYPDIAPITVANFKKLVSQKFYDGLTFHRIISNFMIQGGDPEGTGFGGSDETIKGEFSINGVTNTLPHLYGTISMARTQNDYDSASSQFFICHRDNSSLDGNYAAFGYTIYGLDVLNAIATTETQPNNMPVEKVVINSIRFVDITE